jgi:hypothetical protein
MSSLTRLREKLADANPPQRWTDQQLEAALARVGAEVRYLQLRPIATRVSATQVEFRRHDAPCGDWHEDAELVDANFSPLAPSAADPDLGRWTFATDTPGPVFLTGTLNDYAGAAAELLTRQAVEIRAEFDIRSDKDDLKLSQQLEGVLKMIALFQAERKTFKGRALLGRPTAATLEIAPDGESPERKARRWGYGDGLR